MGIVFAQSDARVGHGKRPISVNKGDAWDDRSEVVKAHPDLFGKEPPTVHGRDEAQVEQATAAPGEKRTTTRKSTKNA